MSMTMSKFKKEVYGIEDEEEIEQEVEEEIEEHENEL